MEVGSAMPLETVETMEIRGRDLVTGPKTITITSDEISEALADTINAIVEAVKVTLEKCPPELARILWTGASCLREAAHCFATWTSRCRRDRHAGDRCRESAGLRSHWYR